MRFFTQVGIAGIVGGSDSRPSNLLCEEGESSFCTAAPLTTSMHRRINLSLTEESPEPAGNRALVIGRRRPAFLSTVSTPLPGSRTVTGNWPSEGFSRAIKTLSERIADSTIAPPNRSERRLIENVMAIVIRESSGMTAIEVWRSLGASSLMDQRVSNEAMSILILTLGTNLNVAEGQESQFANESGLLRFCVINEEILQRAIAQRFMSQQQGNPSSRLNTFAANLPLYCPNVLNSVQLRTIALVHRLRRLSDRQAPALSIRTNRPRAFEEALPYLSGSAENIRNLRTGVGRVVFNGEAGIGPGIIRDWFTEVANQIYNPAYALFQIREADEPPYTELCPLAVHQENFRVWLRAVGRFMALAIVQGNPIGVGFPVMFFAKLLDQELELEDIGLDEPMLYRTLSFIMQASAEDLEDGAFDISIQGEDFLVTIDNRADLVHRKINSLISPQVEEQFQEVRFGFDEVIPTQTFRGIFSPAEVRGLMFGSPTIDVEDLINNVDLRDGYTAGHPAIQWLFTYLRSMDQEALKQFLRFSTGSTQLPLGGFGMLVPRFTIDSGGDDENNLPTSSTCFNQVHLPRYSSEEQVQRKFCQAISETGDFGKI